METLCLANFIRCAVVIWCNLRELFLKTLEMGFMLEQNAAICPQRQE